MTLVGSSWARSTAFYVLPFGALAVAGGKPFAGMNAHAFPLLAIVFSFLTVFGEELGWRGFLQDALAPLRRGPRYALIGLLWEGWHFTTRTHEGSAIEIALRLSISIPALIVLSWIIGLAVERTRSLLVAHSIHCWINLVLQVPSWQASTVFVASVALWLGLLRGWPERHEAAG